MWTGARAKQKWYKTRTEYNKKILMLWKDIKKINPKTRFNEYGLIKNEFMLLEGSVPGPRKRVIAIRKAIRRKPQKKKLVNEESVIATTAKSNIIWYSRAKT